MRLKLFSHYLYLFGGFAFGLSVSDITKLKLSPVASAATLLVSVTLLIAGYIAIRSTKKAYYEELTQQAKARAQRQAKSQAAPDIEPQHLGDNPASSVTSKTEYGASNNA